MRPSVLLVASDGVRSGTSPCSVGRRPSPSPAGLPYSAADVQVCSATEETGWKDIVPCSPGRLVRVLGRFGGATGQFMYHCHVLEHEDESMMRPFVVMPEQMMAIDPHSSPHDH